jgi:hypothetical protein
MSETIYRVNVQYGELKLEPIKHVATWRTHELFDMVSEYMRWTGCDDLTLALAREHGLLVEFTNERPEPPSLFDRIKRIFRGKTQSE